MKTSKQEWRTLLKEGDMVDAVQDIQEWRCSGWSQARVRAVHEDELELEFLHDY